ncbi:hypothetical protein PENSPDRAFT_660097 [Peniophora sp. CONT]|nr:hypothetical protein PENSPDRAFT_660097 [Peniophora sp. CONT]
MHHYFPLPTMSIASLPVEVLLRIFECASDAIENDEGAKTIFRLAGLCRDWRALLLDYPPAWSTICLAHPVATELMLQRSKTAPITIRLDLRGCVYPEAEQQASMARRALERALTRTRELVVIVGARTPAQSVRGVVEMLRGPAPLALETLELIAYSQSRARPTYTITPDNLAQVSQLTTLSLHDTLLDEADGLLAAHCTSLVHLKLRAIQGLSLPASLDIIAAAQGTLETLEIDSLELSNELNNTLTGPIHLSALRELSLLGIESPITHTSHATLLEYIAHPQNTRITIRVRARTAALHVLNAQATLTTYLAARRYEFQSVLLGPTDMGLRLRCWPGREELDLYNVAGDPPALLDLQVSHASDASLRTTASVLSSLAKASNVATVGRAVVAPIDEAIPWARVLVRMPNLIELSVNDHKSLRNLRHACMVSSDPNRNNVYMPAELASAGAPFLANLTTLSVYGLDLTTTGSEESYSDHAELATFMGSLPRRLQKLRVYHCNMRAGDCESLAALVENAHVAWDGIENGAASLPNSTPSTVAEAAGAQEHAVPLLGTAEREERWRKALLQVQVMNFEKDGWTVVPTGNPQAPVHVAIHFGPFPEQLGLTQAVDG